MQQIIPKINVDNTEPLAEASPHYHSDIHLNWRGQSVARATF